jgi:trk system potassium uptake protein TrkH
VLFKRTVPQRTVSLALAVGSFYVIGVSLVTFLIAVFDPQLQLRWILFDVVSAFCTVGLSLGATPLFSETSQILLIFAMLAGRLGPLVLFLAISRSHPERFRVRFPEEDVSVG